MSIECAVACTGGFPTSYSNGSCRCEGCRERFNVYRMQYYRANREQGLATMRKSYARNRDKRIEEKFKSAYGIGYAEREALLQKQGGVCAICGSPPNCGPSKSDLKLHLDHCHQTGRIRGLLCAHCNRALGLFRDDPSLISCAAAYLEGGKNRVN